MSQLPVAQHFPRARSGHRRRLLLALLVVPLLFGVIAAPVAAPRPRHAATSWRTPRPSRRRSRGGSRTRRRSSRASTTRRTGSPARSTQTKNELQGITQDLAATRRRVNALNEGHRRGPRDSYEQLVRDLGDLDLQLQRIELQEAAKRDELRQRKAELADRIREAYEAERTSHARDVPLRAPRSPTCSPR